MNYVFFRTIRHGTTLRFTFYRQGRSATFDKRPVPSWFPHKTLTDPLLAFLLKISMTWLYLMNAVFHAQEMCDESAGAEWSCS